MAGGNTPEIWAKRHFILSWVRMELLDSISARREMLCEMIQSVLDIEEFSGDNPLNLTTIPETNAADERFIYINKYQKEKVLAGVRISQALPDSYICIYFNDGEIMTDDELSAIDEYEWIDLEELNQWTSLAVLDMLTEKIKTYIKENKAKGYEKILD